MDPRRGILLFIFALTSYLLFLDWQQEHRAQDSVVQSKSAPTEANEVGHTATVPTEVSAQSVPEEAQTVASTVRRTVTIETDVLRLTIDRRGGDVVEAALLQYPESLDQPDVPVRLFMHQGAHVYLGQSGLLGQNTPDGQVKKVFTTQADHYALAPGQTVLEVPLTWRNEEGVVFTKTFRVTRGSYLVQLDYELANHSTQAVRARLYTQLLRDTEHAPEDKQGLGMRAYLGAAFSTEDKRYQKYDFDDIREKDLNITTHGGWVAMLQHYFLTAWVPRSEGLNKIYSLTPGDKVAVGILQPSQQIQPGQRQHLRADLYVGPKVQKQLAEIAPGLDLTVDYGVLWWIGQPIFWLMTLLHSVFGNWGVAIIMVTVIVKLLLFPLSNAQYKSFAKMRKLQPKLAALKERYGDDRQKMSQAMMELYKKEKVNPLGGCFPLLLQMPVFFALYWVLLESVELRQAPFFGWIHDLSQQDPYYILPLLMGASMYLMQKMQPTAPNMDPAQQKIMQFMPVMMTVFFLFFPAGLVLYWLTNNILSIVQQVAVTKMMEQDEPRKASKQQ